MKNVECLLFDCVSNWLDCSSISEIDGEERLKVEGKLFTGVFVWRDDLPRFISVRRSNTGEERSYRAAC